jgi:hypothetical protein
LRRIIRVLVNLIDNAIKFSYPNSEVHLRIYKEDTKLIFSVSDNGIGFNLNQREDLFKKFTKWANSELQMKAQRIGLYLCRNIIEKTDNLLWWNGKKRPFYNIVQVILFLTDTDCRFNIVNDIILYFMPKNRLRYRNCDKTLWAKKQTSLVLNYFLLAFGSNTYSMKKVRI